MTDRRDIRTLALQALYQLDARPDDARDEVQASVNDAPVDAKGREKAMAMAAAAWEAREQADNLSAELAPDWLPMRQPAIDRAIIRLAHYEMFSGTTPGKVAVNEAIELAKQFSTERSPAFINGVLDKMLKRLQVSGSVRASDASTGDMWLNDAIGNTSPRIE